VLTVGIDLTARERASAELRSLHAELRRRLDEQAALRRVATLVAAEADPPLVFGAVASQVAAVTAADASAVVRFERSGGATVVGRSGGDPSRYAVGSWLPPDPDSAIGRVLATGEAARSAAYVGSDGAVARAMREAGYAGAE